MLQQAAKVPLTIYLNDQHTDSTFRAKTFPILIPDEGPLFEKSNLYHLGSE